MVRCWGDCPYATVSITQAIFKCGQCDIAQIPVLHTIFCSPHIFAQSIVHRTFLHNLPLSATFCRISCIKIHCITSIHRVNLTWGKLIPWPGASWYHDSRWVDTMTWGELIQALREVLAIGACWHHDRGRVDTMTQSELIPWPGASWYHDAKRVDTACLVVRISEPYDQCF